MPLPVSRELANNQSIVKKNGSVVASAQYLVGRPNVMDSELFLKRVEEILSERNFTNNGRFVAGLEEETNKILGTKHCIAVANGTIGLEILFKALGVQGEVIVPSFTFVASGHAIANVGLKPIFCDIDEKTCSISKDTVEPLINSNTQAILAVNVYGGMCNIDELEELAQKHKLKLIFDSAHSLGCRWNGKWDGGFGDAEVFSLHATKFINGFEGGLITTSDALLAKQLRLARNFGFVDYDKVDCLGTNAKLSEIHAAMALTNLECMSKIIEINRRNYFCYKQYLPPECRLLEFPTEVSSNYQYIVIFVDKEKREPLLARLQNEGIMARRYFYPGLHKFPPYKDANWKLPVTEELSEQVLCLPTGQDIGLEEIKWFCEIIRSFFKT